MSRTWQETAAVIAPQAQPLLRVALAHHACGARMRDYACEACYKNITRFL